MVCGMNNCCRLVLLGLFSASSVFAEGSLQRTLKAFEDKPGYVQPLATSFGSIYNSNWVSSARVPAGFGWEFSLPITLTYLNSDDHTYQRQYETGCAPVLQNGQPCPEGATTAYEVPTIFGPQTNVQYTQYGLDPTGQGYVTYSGGYADDGDETLRKITLMGLGWLQTAFTYQHARVALRGMWAPSSGEFGGYYHAGFALQYSFSHLFAHHLPPKYPIDVSLLTSYNFSSVGFSPKEYTGQLDLDFKTMWHALVVGMRFFNRVELFTEIGYERSHMESSGQLTPIDPEEDEVHPRVSVDGLNGFRATLGIAFNFGTYRPVIGMGTGAQTHNNVNIFNYTKEGTP